VKYFGIKRAISFCGFDLYGFFGRAPLWAIRPLINYYYGDCWAELPEDPPVLFIHIPKNAGSSVETAIYGRWSGHRPASFYMANDERKFKRTTTFAVVRNPYDRFCSMFHHYFSSSRRSPWDEKVEKTFFSRYSNPDELANDIMTKRSVKAFYRTLVLSLPQTDWLMVEGKIAVRHLFRFERLDKVEKFLRDVLQAPFFSLPYVNASRRLKAWEDEIGPGSRRLIENLYKDDMRLWESVI